MKEDLVLIEIFSIIFNKCRTYSFNYTNNRISGWKSAGVFNYPDDDNMKGIENTKTN